MKELCEKYAAKLTAQGLSAPGEALVGGLDATITWNKEDPRAAELEEVFDELGVNSLVLIRPREPYATILDFLAKRNSDSIRPEDTETRTFLHGIPICRDFSASTICDALRRRKSAIIEGHGVISYGTVSPEQGFVFVSSTIFSSFVLFFSDYLNKAREGSLDDEYRATFADVIKLLPSARKTTPALMRGPFVEEQALLAAMDEAGKKVVEFGLVDSFFGNISYRLDNTIHISQTGSSLDELPGCIDPCPMDGSATTGLTASSELSAHEEVYRTSDAACILHGHPKFTVIMSMDCVETNCPNKGQCHIRCSQCRTVEGVPIVPGEVGTGPTGLCNTLPPAMTQNGSAIVHGHGLFALGKTDFNAPFAALLETENRARELYFATIKHYE